MRKITIFLSLLLLIFLKSSCHNSGFESEVEEGKEAIINEEYEKALGFFESALEQKGYNEEIKVLINQTEKMINAIKQQEVGNEFKAIGLFEQVKIMDGGCDRLSEQAKERKEILHQDERDKYDEQLTRAEELKNNEAYEEAKELLTAIIHKTDVYKYLEEQYKRAIEMFDEIDDGIAEAAE